MYYIEVILPLSLNQTFTYELSVDEFDYISIGCRVAVPFGKSKIYTGIVVEKHQRTNLLFEPKEIHQIVDELPIVTEVQIKHWSWIASYYLCSIGEVYRAALPSSMFLASETIIKWKNQIYIDSRSLSDEEYILYEALQKQSDIKISEVSKIIDRKNVLPIIQKMIANGWVEIEEKVEEVYKPKLKKFVRLTKEFVGHEVMVNLLEKVKNAPKQKELVLAYFQQLAGRDKEVAVKDLLGESEANTTTLKALVDKNVFELYYQQEDRVHFYSGEEQKVISLSDFQHKAYVAIKNEFQQREVCVLHGINACGKTHIYAQLIQDTINQNEQALILVPESVLATQLYHRYKYYFEEDIVVYNSKYSANERVEIWNNVQSGKAKVVIGTRSSVFLPIDKLGLIIVDEEHEVNYKQSDPAPRFHARDTAIVLAKLKEAKVVLGSATPSLETYHNAQIGKYGLVCVDHKFAQVSDPKVKIIDLKEKIKRKQVSGHFSDELVGMITERLEKKEQVILFQNRRGFAPILECGSCGHVPQCIRCNVSLTYHKNRNELKCHICGFTSAKPNRCVSCSSFELNTKGFGTEQIEIEAKQLFPEARIARMDADTTRGKYAFDNLLDLIYDNEVDILIGTQMLAKGLDVDNITLVGVLHADQMLYYPDFRSYERAFQSLVQVSGRAGRAKNNAQVVFQTYDPKHEVIHFAKNRDYLGFYKSQITERKEYFYPPFVRMIRVIFKHKDFEKVKEASLWFYKVLAQTIDVPIYGPEEPSINRIRNQYIRVIQLKLLGNKSVARSKEVLNQTHKSFETIGQFKSVKVVIDVDYQ